MRTGFRVLPLLLAGLALASASPAAAAAKPPQPPKGPAGVAVVTDGGRTLFASDQDDQLCLSFSRRDAYVSCERSDQAAVLDDTERATSAGEPGPRHLGVAVPASAVTVEVRRAGRLLATASTASGVSYKGKQAGRVVFAILTLPAGTPDEGLRVRALGAFTQTVAVFPASYDGDLKGPEHRLLSGRSGGTRWSLTRRRVASTAPALFDLDHETVKKCLTVNTRDRSGGGSSENGCVGGAPQDSLYDGLLGLGSGPSFQDECRTGFRLVFGLAPADSHAVLVLGDGSLRGLRTAPFADGRVAYAGVVPAAAAVRSLSISTGARTRSIRLSAAPLRVACAGGGDSFTVGGPGIARLPDVLAFFSSLPPVEPEGPVTRVAGVPGFRVADGPAGSLCVASGEVAFTGLTCPVVGPGYDGEIAASIDSYRRPRAVAIAVPAAVAAVRTGPTGGPLRTIPTVEAAGYTGRYAGLVRFVAFAVGGVQDLDRLDYLDAAGKVLRSEDDPTDPADVGGPKRVGARRLAGGPGRPSLWRTTFRYDGLVRCVAVTDGPAPRKADACQTNVYGIGAPEVLLDVSCSTRSSTVAVLARPGSRVSVRDSRGRARRLVARRGGAIAVLPPSVGVEDVTVARGRDRQRIRLAAPAGARQCGYRADVQPGDN